jgi:hypothetical protein
MASLQSGKGGAPIGKPRMTAEVPLIPTAQSVADEIVNATTPATKPAVAVRTPASQSAPIPVANSKPQKSP